MTTATTTTLTSKSGFITNFLATPQVRNSGFLGGAGGFRGVFLNTTAAADAAAAAHGICILPSNARVHEIALRNDATAGATDYNLGLFTFNRDAGTIAEADYDLFTDGYDVNAGLTAWTDVLFKTLNIDKAEKRLWEMLALASDPKVEYMLVMGHDADVSAVGDFVHRVTWSV